MVCFTNSRFKVLADKAEGLLNVEVPDSSKDDAMPKARFDRDEVAKLIEEKAKEREVDLFIREILEVEQEMFEIEHPGDSVPGKSAFDKFTSTATVHDKIVERKLLLQMIEEIGGPEAVKKLEEARKGQSKTAEKSSQSRSKQNVEDPLLHSFECAECDFRSSPGKKFELDEHQMETGHSGYKELFL